MEPHASFWRHTFMIRAIGWLVALLVVAGCARETPRPSTADGDRQSQANHPLDDPTPFPIFDDT
jgi:hypothetical protein